MRAIDTLEVISSQLAELGIVKAALVDLTCSVANVECPTAVLEPKTQCLYYTQSCS